MMYLTRFSCSVSSHVIARVLGCLVLCLSSTMGSILYAAEAPIRAAWYRYYDAKGVPNISTSVSPNHIRYGYEALDQNLQVIQRVKPFDAEQNLRSASKRQAQSQAQQQDLRLKQAYSNSKTATAKRDQEIQALQRQLVFQQQQLRILISEKVNYKRQALDYMRTGRNPPPELESRLMNNEKEILNVRRNISDLQLKQRQTADKFSQIISRLKTLESS